MLVVMTREKRSDEIEADREGLEKLTKRREIMYRDRKRIFRSHKSKSSQRKEYRRFHTLSEEEKRAFMSKAMREFEYRHFREEMTTAQYIEAFLLLCRLIRVKHATEVWIIDQLFLYRLEIRLKNSHLSAFDILDEQIFKTRPGYRVRPPVRHYLTQKIA